MKRTGKTVFTGVLSACLLLAFGTFALEVVEDELKTDEDVQFENYQGQYNRVMTPAEIRAIGEQLSGRAGEENRRYQVQNKYSIIRAVDTTTNNKFDADIFSLDPAADIVDIGAIRMIIGAYLSRQYDYSREEGELVARFVTVYNAVHRGDMAFYRKRYKEVVTKHMTAANAGISTSYREWPGQTKVVIPVSENVDSSEITDDDVVKKLREKEDKGIPERKKMVDLKKRELEDKKDKLEEKERDIDKREDEIEKEEKKLEDQEKELEKEKEEAEDITDPEEREKEKERLRDEEKKLEEDKEELEQDKEKLEEDREEAEKDKEEISQKEEDIRKDEEEIKKDETEQFTDQDKDEQQKELLEKREELKKKEEDLKKREEDLKKEQQDERIYEGGFYYLKLKRYIPDGHYNNELFLIDAETRKVLLSSPWKNIAGRKYAVFENGVIVIGYQSAVSGKHFLVQLDTKDLTVQKKGSEDIYWKSFVKVEDKHIFAVYKKDEKFYLGRFASDLSLTASSQKEVDKDTFIMFYGNYVYLNSKDKNIFVLGKENLETVDTIEP